MVYVLVGLFLVPNCHEETPVISHYVPSTAYPDHFFKIFIFLLTLIREFFGPSPSAFSGKKSRIIAGDVTVGT